jgi:hypothetical protein
VFHSRKEDLSSTTPKTHSSVSRPMSFFSNFLRNAQYPIRNHGQSESNCAICNHRTALSSSMDSRYRHVQHTFGSCSSLSIQQVGSVTQSRCLSFLVRIRFMDIVFHCCYSVCLNSLSHSLAALITPSFSILP